MIRWQQQHLDAFVSGIDLALAFLSDSDENARSEIITHELETDGAHMFAFKAAGALNMLGGMLHQALDDPDRAKLKANAAQLADLLKKGQRGR